ncbi:Putative Zinc finger, RING-type [Septoria linicola]|uniref:Zinc finger, RING-type n=1 Tax=Septoria linicola TaxID=215465 RepID=A0A9Q9AYD4_9PEZI|nr:Putative Zinc finger, RING-type [Septoria linicola]
MGQGASRHSAEDQADSGRMQQVSTSNEAAQHGSLLEDTTTMTDAQRRRRRRRVSTNRLSQLLRPASDNNGDDDSLRLRPIDHSAPSRSGTLVRRTRSRFQEMLHRNSSSSSSTTTSSRPGLLSHLQRSHYSRSRPRDNEDVEDLFEPPRLPSIDMSATFDEDATFGPHVEPVQSHARSEASSRGPTRRLNAFLPDRPLRQLTSSLRRRRSPGPSSVSSMRPSRSEDQAAMLSRLLSVAAAATAATLMGDDHNALREARSLTGSTGLGDLGGNGEDGSFDGFLRALQNGRIASALRQGSGEGDSESGTPGAPLNFFRMFRFGASEPAEPAVGENGQPAESEGRMVPIIIVGIRSISPSSSSGTGSPSEDLPPFIDALGNFPSPLPAHALGTHGHDSIDSILRPPQNGTSFRHRRRASMGGFGMGRSRLSDRMDDQRDHRSPDRIERRRQRPWSVASSSSNNFEPRPPPATPASPSPELSRISSRNSTPTHSRPTSLVANSMRDFDMSRHNSVLHRSAASPLTAHTEETASIRSTHSGTGLLGDSEPFRLHRRSDTAPNIHYPRFSSGHPRRNGVVEPDNLPPLSRSSTNGTDGTNEHRNSNSDSRSWIIYVLGGSYPENHPILTTPSLFTENPTYEDMMLLSALLGPAKAPVATDDDVQSAGGVYNIESVIMSDDASKTASLVATAAEGGEQVMLETDQRCLVCLCDFEIKDVARKLVKCNHLFHKECIDQWLTTGRNSCPLCRETGVDAVKSEEENEEDAFVPAAPVSASEETVVGVQEAAEVEVRS